MPPANSSTSTRLEVSSRSPEGSRAARRLRRSGSVPGVLYGGGAEPVSFSVNARELRAALTGGNAVIDLSVDGAEPTPALLKDLQRDPVRGDLRHLDLLRVRLDRPIQAVVALELLNGEEAPGVKLGGILEQFTRELTIEALPTEIPAAISHDVSEMQIGETLTLGTIAAPDGVTILFEDPESAVATISAPRLQSAAATAAEGEIATETEVLGEAEAGAADQAASESGEQAEE